MQFEANQKVDKFNPGSSKSFVLIIKIMFLFGVDVKTDAKFPGYKFSKWRSAYQGFVALLWMLYFIYTALSVIIIDLPSVTRISEVLPRKSSDVLAFMIWCVLKTRKRKIYHLLCDIFYLSNNFKVKCRPLWLSFGPVIILGIPVLGWQALTWFFEEDDCRKLIPYLTFGFRYVREGQNCKVFSFATLLQVIASKSLKLAFTVLYIFLCCLIRKILITHSTAGVNIFAIQAPMLDYKYFKRYLAGYDSIIEVLKSFERIMSLPILLVQLYDCMNIFYGIVNLDPIKELSQNNIIAKYFTGIVFVSSVSLTSFLCVCFAATNIHEASKRARDVQERIFKRIITSEPGTGREQMVLLFLNCNNPAFALSASGFFYFTKPMILAAIGSIVTYSLLVMQF
ncbi:hypothetical protein HNY73_007888 [Argiope bruennichi]|uniref:Gustatory receptor n=1 Tax=Argiope bruennichi TaxID=94029 RepID=A0A8T0F4J2_ARGBR|nr:hypothetical protein HNY73_007888 [Argiope bruennichi]